MSLKCQYCGHENYDKASFCGNCGSRLDAAVRPLEPGARPPGPRKRRGISSWLKGSAIGGILGIVFILMGILLFISSITSFIDSAEGAADDPFDTVKGILGGFGIMIVGAILMAVGGILIFFSFIGFIIGVIDSR